MLSFHLSEVCLFSENNGNCVLVLFSFGTPYLEAVSFFLSFCLLSPFLSILLFSLPAFFPSSLSFFCSILSHSSPPLPFPFPSFLFLSLSTGQYTPLISPSSSFSEVVVGRNIHMLFLSIWSLLLTPLRRSL